MKKSELRIYPKLPILVVTDKECLKLDEYLKNFPCVCAEEGKPFSLKKKVNGTLKENPICVSISKITGDPNFRVQCKDKAWHMENEWNDSVSVEKWITVQSSLK